MDDFLHNLRSGKLKQSDRGRRDYADYKGPQRRVTNDRRKTDYYAKVTNENFALIKETLDALAVSQKRIADAMEERKKAEFRIADSLESIVRMMRRDLDGEGTVPQLDNMRKPNDDESVDASFDRQSSVENVGSDNDPDPLGIIASMRDKGDSWEKIARFFDEQNIPTVSGKGKWRGPAVKKYWLANA